MKVGYEVATAQTVHAGLDDAHNGANAIHLMNKSLLELPWKNLRCSSLHFLTMPTHKPSLLLKLPVITANIAKRKVTTTI